MAKRRIRTKQAIKIGLGLFAIAFLLGLVGPLVGSLLPVSPISYIAVIGLLALSGFAFLVASLFLPVGRMERPTFTEELLGRERVQYGVFTEGNWISVLDEKESQEKEDRKRKNP